MKDSFKLKFGIDLKNLSKNKREYAKELARIYEQSGEIEFITIPTKVTQYDIEYLKSIGEKEIKHRHEQKERENKAEEEFNNFLSYSRRADIIIDNLFNFISIASITPNKYRAYNEFHNEITSLINSIGKNKVAMAIEELPDYILDALQDNSKDYYLALNEIATDIRITSGSYTDDDVSQWMEV